MYLECTCADIAISEWERLMSGGKRFSYKKLCRLIKENLPELYEALSLNFFNPYSADTMQTKTHFILVHSAAEAHNVDSGGYEVVETEYNIEAVFARISPFLKGLKPEVEKDNKVPYLPYEKKFGEFWFNPSDIQALLKEGVDGITFFLDGKWLSVSAFKLRAVMSSLKDTYFTVTLSHWGGLTFAWSTGKLRFSVFGASKWYQVTFNANYLPAVSMEIQLQAEGFIEFPATVKAEMRARIEADRLERRKRRAEKRADNREHADWLVEIGQYREALKAYRALGLLQRYIELKFYISYLAGGYKRKFKHAAIAA